ncbi:hypothetical protein NEHOM01_0173 [Nematocida homosporus]|uniref:uncharacterized protein n=1 Tax=Nematocida homosporus TaxID=1912981 RepID=UPI00221F0148|nr:uncharacterized protein NEHOM01_0173 [Nematocida homosporus]KAI5184428.1 hypothetical protein NEHOM01_0173 [Nematocida homosporus]
MTSRESELAARYKNRIQNIVKILGDIFGYEITIQGNRILLRSLFAFDEEDIITLLISETGKIAVEGSPFVKKMDKEKNIYLDKGGSISAFLSAITLTLFDQKTFQ